MTAKEVMRALKADGWREKAGKKSGHRQFEHPEKPGKVTVPVHGGDVPTSVIKSIEVQAGISLR